MPTSSPTRLLALIPLTVGLAVTATFAFFASAGAERVEERARFQDTRILEAVTLDAQHRLQAESDRIEAAAETVAAALGDGIPDDRLVLHLERSLGHADIVDRGRGVLAVLGRHGDRVVVVSDRGGAPPTELPEVGPGLSALDESRWAGGLAYGLDAGGDGLADVVMILDGDLLSEQLVAYADDSVDVDLVGIPGAFSPGRDFGSWKSVGTNLWADVSSGDLAFVAEGSFLGTPLDIETVVNSGSSPAGGVIRPLWLVLVGIGLSLSSAGPAWWAVGRAIRSDRDRQAALLSARTNQSRFQASFANSPIGVVEVGEDGKILEANSRFARQLGYVVEELAGLDLIELFDTERREAASRTLYSVLSGESEVAESDRRYRTRNGSAVWVRETVSAVVDESGVRGALVQAEDVTAERLTLAEMHRRALFDSLTGLSNRANLMARLNRAIESERAPGEVVALVLIDLDDFKAVNDDFGFEAGDLILVEVADRLRRASRSSDTVARLNGDEFIIVCEGVPGGLAAEEAADRFAAVLREPLFFRGREVPISGSIGVVVDADPESADEMLRSAEEAMSEAKGQGRGTITRSASVEDHVPASEFPVTEGELRTALDEGEFRLHYQPICTVPETEVVGFEVLLRWEHPIHGLLTPPAFFGLAEELSLLPRIDAWVLQEGMAALGRFSAERPGADQWYLVFNVAPANFNNRSFAEQVAGYAEDAGVDPSRIVLERNETWFMNQTAGAVLTTRELRSRGVRISLDHYGTAGGPTGDLADLDFDFLKVDRSFVRDACERSTGVLEAIKDMADALDLYVIVEGVETGAELGLVRRAGICLAQGYHLGRPMAEEAVSALDQPIGSF